MVNPKRGAFARNRSQESVPRVLFFVQPCANRPRWNPEKLDTRAP